MQLLQPRLLSSRPNICEQYLKEGECSQRHCNERHIYKCRYFQSNQGCFRGNSCEFLHQVVESTDDHAMNNHEENAEIVEAVSCIETSNSMTKETFVKDTTTSIIVEESEENENVNNYNQDTFVEEVKKVDDKMVEEEEDGYLMLEEAIDAGIELDDDLLDRILEVMDKQVVSKDDGKEKKKKVKKTRKKVSFSAGKGVSS